MIFNRATSQMFNKNKLKLGLTLVFTVMLAACGGGGDSSSPTSTSTSPSPLALNLNAAYQTYTETGTNLTGAITGYCQGTRVWTLTSTRLGTNVAGTSALIQDEYESDFMVANSNAFCKNFYSSSDGGNKSPIYYDPKTYVPISSGSTPPTTVYSNQIPFPTSVTAGSSGTWFNTLSYSGSTPSITSIQTWAVMADTATTLMLITNNKAYTAVGNRMLFNQSNYYRINANNTLTNVQKNIKVTELGVDVFSGGTITRSGDVNINEAYQQPFSSPTLNLNAAYTGWIKGGSSITGTILGYCQGTRQQSLTATVSGQTLSGAAALITNETDTDSVPASSNAFCKNLYSSNGTTSTPYYFDPTNVTPITSGATKNGSPLGLVWSNQAAPPSSVTAGASGTLGTHVTYASDPLNPSGPTIPTQEGSRTWNIVADTPTTLVFITTDIAKVYGTNNLIFTSIKNYRLNANNTLTALYKELQATNLATEGQGYQTIYETYKQ